MIWFILSDQPYGCLVNYECTGAGGKQPSQARSFPETLTLFCSSLLSSWTLLLYLPPKWVYTTGLSMHLLLLHVPSPGLLVTCIAPGHMWVSPEISFSTQNYTVLRKKKPPPRVIPPYQLQVRENETQTGVSKIKAGCNGARNQQHRHLKQAAGLVEFRGSNGVIRSCPFSPFVFSTFL